MGSVPIYFARGEAPRRSRLVTFWLPFCNKKATFFIYTFRVRRLGVLFFLAGFSLAVKPGPFFATDVDSKMDRYEKERLFNRYLDQGLSYFINEQDTQKALESFEKALELFPRNPDARKAYRLAKRKLKSSAPRPATPPRVSTPAASAGIPPRPLEKEPQDPEPKDKADESKEPLSEEDLREIESRYRAGLLAFMEQNYPKTIKEMDRILKLAPNHARAKKLLLRAYTLQD